MENDGKTAVAPEKTQTICGLPVNRQIFLDLKEDFVHTPEQFEKIMVSGMPNSIINIRFHWQQIMALGFRSCINLGCGDNAVGFKFPHVNYDLTLSVEKRYNLDNFVYGNLYKIPFPDKFFDCSVCGDVLEHLANPGLAISEIFRITRKRIVITVPHENFGQDCVNPELMNLSHERYKNMLKKHIPAEEVDKMSFFEVYERLCPFLDVTGTYDHIQNFTANSLRILLPHAFIAVQNSPLWNGYLIMQDF